MNTGSSQLKNRIFFSLVFILSFFVSATFAPGIRLGKYTLADLLLATSFVCGIIYEDRKAVSVIALVAGFLSDIFITPPIHLSALFFFLAAYYGVKTVSVFVKINALSVSVASIPYFFARAIVGCIYLVSTNKDVSLWTIIKTTLLPELAVNVITVFLLYLVLNFIYKKFKRKFFI